MSDIAISDINVAHITVAVTAHNEERTIAQTLASLTASIVEAERGGPDTFTLVVILDRCTDQTEEIVAGYPNVDVIHVTGGLVEAQRRVAVNAGIARPSPNAAGPLPETFVIFCDADVIVGQSVVGDLAAAMRDDPNLIVAYAASTPEWPQRSTLLARALHTYNANDGFEVARHFFSGRCFAIRSWHIPDGGELEDRLDGIEDDRFLRFHDGPVADDIYLSKSIAHWFGLDSFRRVTSATVRFRPPETLDGMYRYARRMRSEIQRVDRLFPEFRRADVPTVGRRLDRRRLAAASRTQQLHWLVFQVAYRWCLMRYALERPYYRYISKEPCPLWPTVIESKRPTSIASS